MFVFAADLTFHLKTLLACGLFCFVLEDGQLLGLDKEPVKGLLILAEILFVFWWL